MLKPIATAALALACLLGVTTAAHAQSSVATKPGFELIAPSGTVVPTGAQGDDVKRANLTAVQLSYGLHPNLVLTSTVGWAPMRLVRGAGASKLDMFSYDAGAEYRLARRRSDRRFNLKPFAGIGVGARTYNYRDAGLATTHNRAAYASAGGEIGLARVRVRLEVRDYLTWIDRAGDAAGARRNDVTVMAGLRLGRR